MQNAYRELALEAIKRVQLLPKLGTSKSANTLMRLLADDSWWTSLSDGDHIHIGKYISENSECLRNALRNEDIKIRYQWTVDENDHIAFFPFVTMDRILEMVNKTLNKLYKDQIHLINNEYDEIGDRNYVSERPVVFWFGYYFYKYVSQLYPYSNMDVEYNRNFGKSKVIADFYTDEIQRRAKSEGENPDKAVIPDLIVHKRGSDDENHLVVEFKGWWVHDKASIQVDLKKIYLFCKNSIFKYDFGMFVFFAETRDKSVVVCKERKDTRKEYSPLADTGIWSVYTMGEKKVVHSVKEVMDIIF